MKRLLLFIALFLPTTMCYSQQEWEPLSGYSWSNIRGQNCIFHKSAHSAILYNETAETKAEKRAHKLSPQIAKLPIYLNRDSTDKRISFYIEDINNDPQHYKYPVYNKEKGKWEYTDDIYWGITINMQGADGKDYYITYLFNNCSSDYQARKSFHLLGNIPSLGEFNYKWDTIYSLPSFVEVTFEENNLCTIKFNNGGGLNIKQIRGITSIEFEMCAGSKIKVYNLNVQQASLYSSVAGFIKDGDSKYDKEEYYAAAMEYSKAINKGYKNYDIYYKRACAFFLCDYFNNAIKDFSDAISYKSTTDAFFGLGISKLYANDSSALEDLQKGGEKGQALIRELDRLAAEQKSAQENSSLDNRQQKTSTLIKDKNFSIK